MNPMIKATHLSKQYGHFPALKDLSFEIKAGRILGLIGPNGAGKTSLLKALIGLTSFQGELEVLGLNPQKQRDLLMEDLCFIADVAILPRWMKVKNALDFVEGVHPRFDRQKALGFLQQSDIKLDNKIKQLSKEYVK